jgi:hypothetical protein
MGMEAAEPILEIKTAAVFEFWRSGLKKNLQKGACKGH